ncbi:sugar phosphate isomerase/epimerase [Planctomycetales bacterium ZRK34]|nr:sugar phosphate isomerase/epimerase [Planctomycetales bacterium ZRK34]
MPDQAVSQRLAVCSWSLEPKTPADLIEKLNEIGIARTQLAIDPIREGGAWADGFKQLADAGIEVVSGMFMAVGEDYSTLDSIKQTGGVVPDQTWPATWENFQQMVKLAEGAGLKHVMFHAGFLPHEPSDPNYAKLAARLAEVANLFADHGLICGLETGQEEATTLRAFLEQLGKPNVAVNFDPANMILYDKGDPIAALQHLMPHVRSCHIKDATRTITPGQWGAEVVVGTGQVDWPAFFDVLKAGAFDGLLAIEREAGEQRVADIRTAKDFVLNLVG